MILKEPKFIIESVENMTINIKTKLTFRHEIWIRHRNIQMYNSIFFKEFSQMSNVKKDSFPISSIPIHFLLVLETMTI